MSELNSYPVLVITGAVGVGKTTTAEALSDLLVEQGVAHTYVDMDALTATWPRPPDDRFNGRLGFRNLTDIVKNGREIGSARLILAGVTESRDGRDRYVQAIPGAEVSVVRLIASIELIHERIASRASISGGSEARVTWEKDRSAELIEIMDAADVADICVDTTDRSPAEVAREIGAWLGWIPDRHRS